MARLPRLLNSRLPSAVDDVEPVPVGVHNQGQQRQQLLRTLCVAVATRLDVAPDGDTLALLAAPVAVVQVHEVVRRGTDAVLRARQAVHARGNDLPADFAGHSRARREAHLDQPEAGQLVLDVAAFADEGLHVFAGVLGVTEVLDVDGRVHDGILLVVEGNGWTVSLSSRRCST